MMDNPFYAMRNWVQGKFGYGPNAAAANNTEFGFSVLPASSVATWQSPEEYLRQHPDYLRQTRKRRFDSFPGADLMQKVMPAWLNVPLKSGPRHVFTLPENEVAYGEAQPAKPRLHWGTAPTIGLHPVPMADASQGGQLGMGTLAHELAHYYQMSRQNMNATTPLSEYSRMAKSMNPSGYTDRTDVPAIEQEAEIMRGHFLNLWQAKQENDYQTSIGLRPH